MDSLVAAIIVVLDAGLPPGWSTSTAGMARTAGVCPLAAAGFATFEAFGAAFSLWAGFWAGVGEAQAVSSGFSRHAGIWAAALLARSFLDSGCLE